MNKFTIVLAVFIFIFGSSIVYAEENESTQEEKTNEKLKENEKQVKEILDPNNKSLNLKQKVRKLTEIGEQAVPFLIDEINSGENVYVAAQALNKIMGKKCIPDLFNAYVIRSKTSVGRYYLAFEIRIHKKDSLKYLFEKMKDEDELVRMNAVELIAYCDRFNSIDELKVQYENDESNLVKLQIIKEIYDVDNRSQRVYLSFVHEMIKSTNEDLKLKALDVTIKINDETQIDLIISFLDDKSFEVRKKAIKTLLHYENVKSIEAVINSIKHSDVETAMKAVIYLGSHYYKNKEIEKTVIKALVEELSNEEKNMRMKVVMSLGSFSELEIIPHLEKIAETDPDEIIRERAKLSIKIIQLKLKRKENLENSKKNKHNYGGPKESEENELSPVEKQINEILNQELKDDDKIKKLVEIGEPATQYLLLMLYDEDKKIVFISASALKEIKEILCLPQLVEAYLIRKNDGLEKVILSYKKEAFSYLQSKLNDKDEFVRVKIVSLIVLLRDEKSDDVLKNHFKLETSDRVKLHIAMFLKNSFTEPRVEYLAFIYKMLESQDDELKCKALNILRTCKDFTQIALMIKLTRDNSRYVRSAALYAINEYECVDTVDAILEALNHEDEDTRNIAASCLLNHCFKDKELEKKSIKALINALIDEDYRVRCSVIRALSVRDDMSIIPHLEKIAKEDTIDKNREYAIQAIKQIKKRNGIVEEDDETNDNDKSGKQISVAEFKVNKILDKVKRGNSNYFAAINDLVEIGEEAVPYLTKALESENDNVVIIVAHALYQISKEKFLEDLLKAYVKHIKTVVQVKIGQIIELAGDPVLPRLYKELENDDSTVRYWIVDLVSRINVKKSLDILKRHYDKEVSNNVKLQIIKHIYSLDADKKDEYLKFVHEMLNDNDELTKCIAIYVVGEIKDETQIEFLKKCLDDESQNIRVAAIHSILNFENEDVVQAVINSTKHEDIQTRCIAISELSLHHYESKELTKKVISALIEALSDDSWRVRISAISALSSYDDLTIIPHLEKIAENDPEENVRKLAKSTIEIIKRNKKNN